MAVYVLLTFDKDDDAKLFVNQLIEQRGVMDYTNAYCEDYQMIPANLRGVWKKPTLFCTREKPGCSERSRGYTRGKKYGWWVCVGCGKPSWRWAQGNAWFTALGTNLLPQSQIAPEYRPPGGDPKVLWDFLPSELLNSIEPHVEWTFKNDYRTHNAIITKKEKTDETPES